MLLFMRAALKSNDENTFFLGTPYFISWVGNQESVSLNCTLLDNKRSTNVSDVVWLQDLQRQKSNYLVSRVPAIAMFC